MLELIYKRTFASYQKLSQRLEKSIRNGRFFGEATNKQNQRIHRVEKLRQKLEKLQFQLKVAAAAGGVALALSSSQAQAQNLGLGPFVEWTTRLTPVGEPMYFTLPAHTTIDIDGDGDLDLYVGTNNGDVYFSRNLQIELGSVGALFNDPVDIPDFGSSYSNKTIEFADMDADGDLDAITSFTGGACYPTVFFRNDGGTFVFTSPFDGVNNPFSNVYNSFSSRSNFTFLDIDGDTDLELFAGNGINGYIDFFNFNDGTKKWETSSSNIDAVDLSSGHVAIAFLDVTGDTNPDAFVADQDGFVTMFAGYGNGNFNMLGTPVGLNPFNGIDFGYKPFIEFADIDMDGDKDFIVSNENTSFGTTDYASIRVFENDGANNFTPTHGIENPFGGIDVGDDADVAWADIDNDNDMDLFVGSNDNWIYFYENKEEIYGYAKFVRVTGAANPLPADPGIQDASPQFGDLDQDGDQDLYVGTRNSGLYYFKNSGTPFAASFDPNDPLNSLITEFESTPGYEQVKPTLGDLDVDGDLDAMVGTGYTVGISVYYMINVGNPTPPSFSKGSEASAYLNYHDLQLVDLDHDGDADLVVGGDLSDNRFFQNTGAGLTELTNTDNPFDGQYGFNFSPSFVDFDDDGDLDQFLGNKYGGIDIFENVNQPVVLDLGAGDLDIPENTPATAGISVTITDPDAVDNTEIVRVFIKMNGFVPGEDVIDFTDQFNITGSFNGPGDELTLTGADSFANYQTAVSSITYQNISDDPDVTPRLIDYEAWDSDFTDPTIYTKTINIIAINDPPEPTIGSSSITFTEDGAPVNVDGIFFVIDDDDTDLVGATISIAGHIPGQDEFIFTTQNGISGVYDDVTGIMTLSGISSVANYQAAMRTLQFNNTSDDPTAGSRTILIVMDDGTDPSLGISQTIDVVAVNDDPVLAGEQPIIDYTSGSGVVSLGPTFTIADVDDVNMSAGQFVISGGYVNGDDVLSFVDGGTVVGNFTAATGTMSLSSIFSIAEYEGAMNSVFYENVNPTPDHIDRTVDMMVRDETTGISSTLTTSIALPPVLTFDSSPLSFQEDVTGAVLIDPAFVITDDQATIEEATITIGSFVSGEDVLNFTDQNGITGSFASGTLTLSGSTTLANYETAIRSVEYENTSQDPNTIARTLNVNVSAKAATLTSLDYSRVLSVLATNDLPVLSVTAGNISYFPTDPPTIIDPGITIADIDDTDITEAIVQVTQNYVQGDDALLFTDQLGITGSFDGLTGTLTLTGTTTIADYETAISSIQYQNNNLGTNPASREISFSVKDALGTSLIETRTIDLGDNIPTVSLTAGGISFTENDGPTPIDAGLSLTDDTPTLASATISLTGFVSSEDILNFTSQFGITGSYNSGTGILALSGSATPSEYETVLRSVTYENTSEDPSITTRSVDIVVSDGFSANSPVSRSISILAVNDPPNITSTASAMATEDLVYTYSPTVVDPDDVNDGTNIIWTLSGQPVGMTVSSMGVITWTPGEGVSTSGTVTLSVEDGDEDLSTANTEVFTITVTAVNDGPIITSSAATTATEDISYSYTAVVVDPDDINDGTNLAWSLTDQPAGMTVDPTGTVSWLPTEGVTTSGAVTLTVQDGGEDGALPFAEIFTVSVTPVNDPPTLTLNAISASYTENDPNVTLDNFATIADSDNTSLSQITLTITNFQIGEDELVSSPSGPVSGSFDAATGILTISGAGTLAEYETVLRSVGYQNTSDDPDLTPRDISIVVDDGTDQSSASSFTVNITAVNDLPVLTGAGTSLDHSGGISIVDNTILASDVDNINMSSAQVSITTGFLTGTDLLSFTPQGAITGSYDGASGVLSLTGAGTVAEYSSVLQSVTYENTSGVDVSTRTVDFIVNDGSDDSNFFSRTINVNISDLPPVLTLTSSSFSYTENDGPVSIDPGVSIVDDSPQIIGGEVSIISNFENGDDVLGFADQAGISGVYDAFTGILTLTGNASTAQYEAALASLTFENTSENPGAFTKTIEILIEDGINTSSPVFMDIQVTPVNDAPQLSGSSTDLSYRSLTGSIVIDDQIIISDVDDTDLLGATISVSSGYSAGEDLLLFTDQNGITGSFNSVTGVLSLSGTASLSVYETALGTVEYENTVNAPSAASKQIDFAVSDLVASSNISSRTIQVQSNQVIAADLSVNAPVGVNSTFDVIGAATFTSGDIITTTILSGPSQGVASVQADGSILYTPAIDASGTDVISYELCNEFSSCDSGNLNITIDNEAPVVEPVTETVEPGGIATISLPGLISDANNNVDPNSIVVISNESGVPITIDADLNLIVNYANSDFIDQVDHIIVQVCDFSGLCTEQEIKIAVGDINEVNVFNGVTPNNDGINDVLKIQDVEFFPNNEMSIYSKIGELVYNISGYNNIDVVFDGHDNEENELPDGTYYYVIVLDADNRQSGFFVLQK